MRYSRGIRSNRGFTIIELVTMTLLVAIVAAVAIFRDWSVAGSNALRVAVDQVISDLRFAQISAMGASTSYSVTFQANGTTYWVGAYPSNDIRKRELRPNVRIKNSTTVTFNSLGEYVSGSNALLTLEAGGAYKVVEVQTITGRIAEK